VCIESLKRMNIRTPYDLRKLQKEIINCEIAKGTSAKSIYIDLDLNSIYKTIILIEKKGNEYFQYEVWWFDPIE